MRLTKKPQLIDKRMGRAIERFLEFTGKDVWEKQIEELNQVRRSKKYIAYEAWLLQRNPFLVPLEEFFELCKKGKPIWKYASSALKDFATNVFKINIVTKELNDLAKKKILGTFRSRDGIKSFLFELQIATHFLIRRFNVFFVDLEGLKDLGTFDFLVEGKDIRAEIECKRMSVDAGQKITRGGFYLLTDEILSRLGKIRGVYAINIMCQNRLGKRQDYFGDISRQIVDAITEGKQFLDIDDNLSVQILPLSSGLRIRSDEEAAKVLAPHWSPKAHYAVLSNDERTIIIRAESEKTNKVLSTIHEELKKGRDQFTRERPTLLSCFIEEIDERAWAELRRESGLANMTQSFFINDRTGHINIVAYSSNIEADDVWSRGFTRNLFFRNPSPQFPTPKTFSFQFNELCSFNAM